MNKKKPRKSCGYCRKEVGTPVAKFCSQQCHVNHRYKSLPFSELKTDNSRRRRMIREVGLVCGICKIVEWGDFELPVPVSPLIRTKTKEEGGIKGEKDIEKESHFN